MRLLFKQIEEVNELYAHNLIKDLNDMNSKIREIIYLSIRLVISKIFQHTWIAFSIYKNVIN